MTPSKPSRWPVGVREFMKHRVVTSYRTVTSNDSDPDVAAERYYRRLVFYYVQKARLLLRNVRYYHAANDERVKDWYDHEKRIRLCLTSIRRLRARAESAERERDELRVAIAGKACVDPEGKNSFWVGIAKRMRARELRVYACEGDPER